MVRRFSKSTASVLPLVFVWLLGLSVRSPNKQERAIERWSVPIGAHQRSET